MQGWIINLSQSTQLWGKEAAFVCLSIRIGEVFLISNFWLSAPLRGELVGESEKTTTDKKRQRRAKKIHQKEKAKKEQQKLKYQLKKKTRDGLLTTDASVKLVEQAVKKGQIRTVSLKSLKITYQ